MDNLIDSVRSLLSVNVVEDAVRSLGENRERVTRALFGVVPAVIARWAIDLQSALEEERLSDRLLQVKGLANELQSQDWAAQIAREILESDAPEETAQRIFGDAPIDELFLEATSQYLRVPERLIKALAPLVDGICLIAIALKLAPDNSNIKTLFEFIKGQEQFIPGNMLSMLAGRDVLTSPVASSGYAAASGRGAIPHQSARTTVIYSDPSNDGPNSQGNGEENLALECATTSKNSQPFSGGEIRWVVEEEPSGVAPHLLAKWNQQSATGRVRVVGGIVIALLLVAVAGSVIFGGGENEGAVVAKIDSLDSQVPVAIQVPDAGREGANVIKLSVKPGAEGVKADLNLDTEIGDDEDTRAMLAAVKQAHAELEANPGKKVMSQPLTKSEPNIVKKSDIKDDASGKIAGGDVVKDSVRERSIGDAAVKYNDAIRPEDLTQIAARLSSKDAPAGVRNGSSFLLNGISFERSTSKLERAASQPLKALAKILIENPDLNLKIIGHSDNSGRPDKNKKLSLVRAWSVESELRNLGVVGARIRSEGKGATEPRASNTTEEGREQNRRIEFVLYRARE